MEWSEERRLQGPDRSRNRREESDYVQCDPDTVGVRVVWAEIGYDCVVGRESAARNGAT